MEAEGPPETGIMSLAEAQEIHGLLNFATGYFAGRSLKYACFKIFSLVNMGRPHMPQLRNWCEEVLLLLSSVQPRTIPININTRTVLVFTDGSWEDGIAGLGAILLDESTGLRVVIQDRVQENLLMLWKGGKVLLFVGNTSARGGGTVKGRSSSPTMDDLVKAFYSIEVHLPSFLVGRESAQQK